MTKKKAKTKPDAFKAKVTTSATTATKANVKTDAAESSTDAALRKHFQRLTKAALVDTTMQYRRKIDALLQAGVAEDPLAFPAMLKDWILAFNKVGIGLWMRGPIVHFACDGIKTEVHYRVVLERGLYAFFNMYLALHDNSNRGRQREWTANTVWDSGVVECPLDANGKIKEKFQ